MMQCPACARENRPGVRFCEQCGASLELACPTCGARLPAASKFCGECGACLTATEARFAAPQVYTPPHLAERILKDRGALAGERKQVTVLFADVSGFTSLSERLDPEDVHGLINGAFELMLAEVHRYEGTVNQFLGDGLMALFGAPVAHEDHAVRAAHAALGMQRALGGYREELQRARGVDFRVRLGLNTGLVVVGAIGDNLRMDYTAVGDTTNTAARMQQLAEPGQIVLAEATERLVAPYFELHALGTVSVKNRTQPVAAWELVGGRAGTTRLAARAARGLSPLVGRADALATLERAWGAAQSGRGQVALVVGEAGIGKSRLLLEFRERLGKAAAWIEGDCVSFGQTVPFLAITELLKRHFAVTDRDTEREVIEKIQRGLEPLGPDATQSEPFLRYLLAVDPGDGAVAVMEPAQRRARIVAAVQRLVAAISRRGPQVLVVEDLHWIDSGSEDLLKSLADSLPGMAALLIVTYRPVYQQPFGDRTYFWRIALQPLHEPDAIRVVRATLGVNDLPRELAGVIAAKAEGNPFFLEEIGHALLETGAVRAEGGQLLLTRAAATITVPETVQDVIAARLDRLEEAQKRTVQTAAVIGREFALTLLRRVTELHDQLEQSLADLKRLELIYEKAGFGDPEYVFRHALTQDVAYGSLLQAERRRLHALIGAAIEELYAGRVEERAEELVQHFTRGEVWDKVVRYARDAAERAAALCVDDKAVEFYQTALTALGHQPDAPDRARHGIEIRLAMRAPLWRGGRPDELFALFKEAEELASRHGMPAYLDTIYAFLVQYHWARGEQDRAQEYGARCLERATATGDLGLRITGLLYLAHAHNALGQPTQALEHAREIIGRLEGGTETERFGLSGFPYSGACVDAAEALVELGDAPGALEWIERGRRVADGANHLYSQMVVAQFHGHVLTALGRTHEAITVLEATVATCRDKRFVGQLVNALRHLGHAYVMAGRSAEAIAPELESAALQQRANVFVNRSSNHLVLAQAYLDRGDLARAEAELRTALDFARRHGERGVEGQIRLTWAELATRRGDRAGAERCLDLARGIAEERGLAALLERCRALARALAGPAGPASAQMKESSRRSDS